MALTMKHFSITQTLTKTLKKIISVKVLTIFFITTATVAAITCFYNLSRIQQIEAFNLAISSGKPPKTDLQSFEAKFSTAYWLAQNERYKESTLLFNKALNNASTEQKAAIHYNIGNIFFRRGLAIGGTSYTVKDEAEYLLMQAKTAYQLSLRLDNTNWGARHNLDRLLTMLPETPTPGVGESDSPGLIMGSIPVGLP
jgi:tetratricopeptide (TPR) repeat protein